LILKSYPGSIPWPKVAGYKTECLACRNPDVYRDFHVHLILVDVTANHATNVSKT